jgi:hypothetical protein
MKSWNLIGQGLPKTFSYYPYLQNSITY